MAADPGRVSGTPTDGSTGWIDANVVLRFLLGDHPEHSPRASSLVARAESGKLSLVLVPHIICEVVYVLEGQGYSRHDISQSLTRFCLIEGINVQELDLVLTALLHYRDTDLDFADLLLYSVATHHGGVLWTFDKKHFRRLGQGWQEPS